MAYTWGYIKEATLSLLQIDEQEANTLGHLNRFPFAANEVLSQIATSVKPDQKFLHITIVTPSHKAWLESIGQDVSEIKLVKDMIKMPDDFLEFGEDVNTIKEVCFMPKIVGIQEQDEREASDEDFKYVPYNHITFLKSGHFVISYNAYWPVIDAKTDNNFVLPWARDISECLPSYIAYKCFKLDNEEKAAIYRNEFEILFSRIARANYQNTRTFKVGGDW